MFDAGLHALTLILEPMRLLIMMAGVVLGGLALWWGSWWLWCLVGVCVLAGGLAVFEGRKKWCVLRAMGVKTPV